MEKKAFITTAIRQGGRIVRRILNSNTGRQFARSNIGKDMLGAARKMNLSEKALLANRGVRRADIVLRRGARKFIRSNYGRTIGHELKTRGHINAARRWNKAGAIKGTDSFAKRAPIRATPKQSPVPKAPASTGAAPVAAPAAAPTASSRPVSNPIQSNNNTSRGFSLNGMSQGFRGFGNG